MVEIADLKTGEIFELRKEVSPFRTLTDLKDYHDEEQYEKGSSQVDLTGYEPLESIIARCTRTMVAPGGQTYTVVDMDAIKAESQVVPSSVDYEAEGAETVDDAFDTEDPTTDPDFDLADASRILNSIGSVSEEMSRGMANSKANDDADYSEQTELKLSESSEEADEIEKKANAG